jgi:hypothetical protein
MTRKDLKAALGSSLQAEEKRIKDKFEKAEHVIKGVESYSHQNGVPSAESQQHKSVVRDSFTMPENDYELIELLRQRCLKNGVSVTKSEVFRAGLHVLSKMSNEALLDAMEQLEKIKTGRPTSKNRINS